MAIAPSSKWTCTECKEGFDSSDFQHIPDMPIRVKEKVECGCCSQRRERKKKMCFKCFSKYIKSKKLSYHKEMDRFYSLLALHELRKIIKDEKTLKGINWAIRNHGYSVQEIYVKEK